MKKKFTNICMLIFLIFFIIILPSNIKEPSYVTIFNIIGIVDTIIYFIIEYKKE